MIKKQHLDKNAQKNLAKFLESFPKGLLEIEPPFSSDPSKSEKRFGVAIEKYCKKIGCSYVTETVDNASSMMLDGFVMHKGQKYIIEFNGPPHFVYDGINRAFESHTDEIARQRILNFAHQNRTIFFKFFELDELMENGMELESAIGKMIQNEFSKIGIQ